MTRLRTRSERSFVFTAALIGVALLISLLSQHLPSRGEPRRLTAARTNLNAVWPQGWYFFAAEPSSETLIAYHVDDAGRSVVLNEQQFGARTDWGISRAGYAQYVEIADLASKISGGKWLSCARLTQARCREIAEQRTSGRLINGSRNPTLCGRTLLAVARPRGWLPLVDAWEREWKITRIASATLVCGGRPSS